MSGRERWIGALLPLLLTALVAMVACEDDPVCAPEVPAGTVRGTVRTGGVTGEAWITARKCGYDASFESPVEADGSYSVDLPAGDYVIQLRFRSPDGYYRWTGSGPAWGSLPADTLRVGSLAVPHVADFDLGALVLETAVPAVFDEQYLQVHLHPIDEEEGINYYGLVREGYGEIEGGRVTVSMPGVLPGTYRIELMLGDSRYSDSGERIWLPGTRDVEAADPCSVGVDERVDLACSFPTTPAHLTGSVTGAWLEMGRYGDPKVTLVTTDSLLVSGPWRVDDDGGAFALDILWPEPVKVMVSDDGIEQWIGGSSFQAATVLDLTAGQVTTGADFVQNALLLDFSSTDLVIGSVIARLCDPTDHAPLYEKWITPGPYAAMVNLPAGDYLLQLVVPEWYQGFSLWRPQWYDRMDAAEAAQVITIGDGGDIATRDVVLEMGGQILGVVQQHPDSSLGYAVLATPADENAVWGYDHTSVQWPEFELTGLPDGGYKVGVIPSGEYWGSHGPAPEETYWHPGTTDWNAATVFEIIDASVHADVTLETPEG